MSIFGICFLWIFFCSASRSRLSFLDPVILKLYYLIKIVLLHLSDTEKFYTEVQEAILARFNKTFDWSLKAKMMGRKAIEAARIFVEETGISDSLTAEQFLVEREAMLQSLFPTSELMPGDFVYLALEIIIFLIIFMLIILGSSSL